MIKYFILIIVLTAFSCGQSTEKKATIEKKTESDSDVFEGKFKSFNEYSIYFYCLFQNNLGECSIDQYGNISIDNGSASQGRVSFRIIDVQITMEERPEEPGCADVCPPRVIISFECKGGGDCITDPGVDFKYPRGILVFPVEHGRMAYGFLLDFKRFIEKGL